MPRSVATKAKPAAGSMTLAEMKEAIARHYESEGKSSSSLKLVDRVFRILMGNLDVVSATDLESPVTARRFAAALTVMANLNDRTRSTVFGQYKAICRLAHRLGLLSSVPSFPSFPDRRDLPKGNRSAPPAKNDVDLVMVYLKNMAEDREGRRLYALAAAAAYGECRLRRRCGSAPRILISPGVAWVRRKWGGGDRRSPSRSTRRSSPFSRAGVDARGPNGLSR